MLQRHVFENRLFYVDLDGEIARIVRTAEPLMDLTEFRLATVAVSRALGDGRARVALMDLRGGPPGRNDPEFEEAGASWRRLLAERFDKVAVLVRTQAGRLQAQRLARQSGRVAHVFMEEREALQYLRSNEA
jgi:hypothetical protein